MGEDNRVDAPTKAREGNPPDVSTSAGVDAMDAIPLTVRIVLGTATISVGDIARLEPGSLVKLDRKLGQPVDLMVDDRILCRGEIGVSEDAPPRFVLKIVELNVRRSV